MQQRTSKRKKKNTALCKIGVVVVCCAAGDVVAWTTTTTQPAQARLLAPRRLGRSGRSASNPTTRRAAKKVFIDGEAGTTGLQVRERLARHPDIEIVSLPAEQRKDVDARRAAINAADAVVLCLPDAAAIEAAALAGPEVRIVDASTAHRVADDWVYGFAEMDRGRQREKIRTSTRVSNPGCYATGFVALIRPLVDAGVLAPDARLACSAISGYTGGGKALCEVHEKEGDGDVEPWGAYGLALDHKHLPEMAKHAGLANPPLFAPAVGHFPQGMVVSVLVPDGFAATGHTADEAHSALTAAYAGEDFVRVAPFGVHAVEEAGMLNRGTFLDPTTCNGSNNLDVFVFESPKHNTALLCARLDNLGKGASAAAVQNLNIMLDLDPHAGLDLGDAAAAASSS